MRAFLAGYEGAPVTWGRDDCSGMVARWIEAEAGRELAIPPYADRAGAERLIAAAGSLAGLWRSILSPAGIHETGSPVAGDVAVVRIRSGHAGGIILDGGYVAWRAAAGVTFLRSRDGGIVTAWSVPAR